MKIQFKAPHYEAFRFLVSGGLNTFIVYVLYLLLLNFFHYQIAYGIVTVIGILSAYWLNSRFVFRQKHSWHKLIIYPIIYLIQYGLNSFLLWILVEKCKISPAIALLIIVITVVAPLSFALNRFVLKTDFSKIIKLKQSR
ncbi:MAG: polysaccharide synthesis protein GtrA [Gammaproteobacteria bacterium]|nr:polysaccharide synthesis protein GtrA [Gammaproteobacteria bacterium]